MASLKVEGLPRLYLEKGDEETNNALVAMLSEACEGYDIATTENEKEYIVF